MVIPVDEVDGVDYRDPVTVLKSDSGNAYTVEDLEEATNYAQQTLSKKLREAEAKEQIGRKRVGSKDYWFSL